LVAADEHGQLRRSWTNFSFAVAASSLVKSDFRRQERRPAPVVRRPAGARTVTLTNVPRLQDVNTTLKLLRNMGCRRRA